MGLQKQTNITEEKLLSLPIVGALPKSEKEEKHLKTLASFEFSHIEEQGQPHSFSYGSSKNRVKFDFEHGQTYRVPRHVARHLEKCSSPIWDYRPNGTGQMEKQQIGNKSRFQMREVFEG